MISKIETFSSLAIFQLKRVIKSHSIHFNINSTKTCDPGGNIIDLNEQLRFSLSIFHTIFHSLLVFHSKTNNLHLFPYNKFATSKNNSPKAKRKLTEKPTAKEFSLNGENAVQNGKIATNCSTVLF